MNSKTILLLAIFLVTNIQVYGQLPDGSIAPSFTATDINGVKYNLYDILDEGKSVVIDFSATWCGPCWSYKQSGVLEDFYSKAGPNGTNTVMVFFVESDASTTLEDLKNPNRDWVTGTNHPIIDDASIGNKYHIHSYPTVLMVCKDGKIKNGIRGYSVEKLIEAVSKCPDNKNAPNINFFADIQNGCQALEVQFKSSFWPRPNKIEWDFGDGEKSDQQNPTHTFSNNGNFDVSVKASNEYGETIKKKESFIKIGKGITLPISEVGPKDKDFGSGRYFEGGHQGLIFTALKPIVLSEVTVFSNEDREREIVLEDKEGNLLNSKTIFIPKGEHIISLEFFVDKGIDYRIGLYSDAYLFRNDSGVNYPYKVENLVNITKSTASKEGYYYYYYNWKVREAGCTESNSIDEYNIDKIDIYPNPVTDIIYLSLNSINNGSLNYSIIDLQGKVIISNTFKVINGTNSYQISLKNIAKGIYFIKVFGNHFNANKKIIIDN